MIVPKLEDTEDHLRNTSGFDLKDRTNLRYYVAMHSVACLAGKAAPESQDIAALDLKALDCTCFKASSDTVLALYKKLGGTDQVAKGPLLRDAVKEDLVSRFVK